MIRIIWSGAIALVPVLAIGCNSPQMRCGCSPCQCNQSCGGSCGMNRGCGNGDFCGGQLPGQVPATTPPPTVSAPSPAVKHAQFDPFTITEQGGVTNAGCSPCSKGPVVPAMMTMPIAAPQRPTFNPFAITEQSQPAAKSCDCQSAMPAQPAAPEPMLPAIPLSVGQPTTPTTPSRPAFDPFAITDNMQMNTAAKMPAQLPASLPTNHYHNDDYTVLAGELHYNPRMNTWRLRYATVDVVDLFGGSVTLADAGLMLQGYQSGQSVIVEGEMADLNASGMSPPYRIRHVWPAKP